MFCDLEKYDGRFIIDSQEKWNLLLESGNHDFSRCMFCSIKFINIMGSELLFENCIFNSCNFRNSIFTNTVFSNSSFYDCDICMCDFANAHLIECHFASSRIDKSNLKSCLLHKDVFRNSWIRHSELTDADFLHVEWNGGWLGGVLIATPVKNLNSLKVTFGGATNEECERLRASILKQLGK